MKKRWLDLYLISILGCTISVVVIPCLFGGLFFLSLFLLYQKSILKKDFLILNSLLLVMCGLVIIFFKLFSPSINLSITYPFKEILLQSLSIWKAVLHSITTLFFECAFLIFIAFLINKYLIKNNQLNNLFFFILAQVIIGITLFQGLNKLDNAYQFPYFAYSASGFILIIAIVLTVDFLKKRIIKLTVAGLIISVCFYISYSYSSFSFNSLSISLENKNLLQNDIDIDWVKRVSDYVNTNKNLKGGFVLCKADLHDIGPKQRSCISLQTGSFISYISDNCNLPNLTCKDTLLSDENLANKEEFEKLELWMEVFPLFNKVCNVNDYIRNNKVDYFIGSINLLNIDTTIENVILDKDSKYVFVCKKSY